MSKLRLTIVPEKKLNKNDVGEGTSVHKVAVSDYMN